MVLDACDFQIILQNFSVSDHVIRKTPLTKARDSLHFNLTPQLSDRVTCEN